MLLKIVMFILGIIITSISLMFIIMYLNLCIMGYTFFEYLNFISKEPACFMIILGILLIALSMYRRKGKINDIHI